MQRFRFRFDPDANRIGGCIYYGTIWIALLVLLAVIVLGLSGVRLPSDLAH